jgi:hypothetical protein
MNTLITANKLVAQYGLLPHPEGGYYKENYRSSERIQLLHFLAALKKINV